MRVALDRVVVERAMRAHRDEKSSPCASTSHSNVATPSRDGETRDDAPNATAQDDEVSIRFYASPARDADDGAPAHGKVHSDDDDDDRPMPSETFDEDFKRRSSCVSLERRRACVPPATLALEYWTRDEATTEAKKKHIDALDRALGSYGVEEHIERTVLKDAGTVLEANMFPYACPPGVTHRTLWSRAPMDGDAIVEWVCAHLRENFTGGVYDAIAGIARCVDDTPKSLREDPVRMLRAIRLAARHGFTMTKELRAGLRAYAPMLKKASSMRVTQEIRTLMHGGYSETTMKLFWHSTLMKGIFPTQFDFLVKRLPTAKTLTYELDSTFTTSKRDVDGGASLLFNALKAYDDVVKSRGAAERHRERPVAEWLALLAAPIAMTRLLEHDAFKGVSSTLPAPWRGGATPESAPELLEQWEAFTGAVLDVLEDMSSEGHASANPEALDVFVKGDLSAALLILLAHGPMFALSAKRASKDALGWYHADFLSPRIASAALAARIKPYAKTKKAGWFQASFYPEDIDLIRACLAAPKP